MKTQPQQNTPLVFEGDLAIHRADELRKIILDFYKNNSALQFAFGKVGVVDISFLQLLCAFHRQVLADRRSISVKPPVPVELKRIMKSSGYDRSTCCAEGQDADCIWKTIMEAT